MFKLRRRRQVRDQLKKATTTAPPVTRIERAVWPYLHRGR